MKRVDSFDLARGFTVLLMPSIHVCMMYSRPEVQQSLLGVVLGFIAEGPGAQLFMLLMGVNFAFRHATSNVHFEKSGSTLGRTKKISVLRKAVHLFLAGYLLNFFKFIVPLGLGLMPDNLIEELQLKSDFDTLNFFLLIGDILHFAAIAYILLYMVTRTKYYPYLSLVLAIIIIFISPLVWDFKTGNPYIDVVLKLFNGHPPETFFPVFPWLVYPMMGLTIGLLMKCNNETYILKKIGLTGIGILILSFCFPPTRVETRFLAFYRTEAADTLFHTGFVFIWLSIFHWLSKKIKTSPVFSLLRFCSRQITMIYILQWVLICWCMEFSGYMQLGLMQTLGWMGAITLITLLLTYKLTFSNPSSSERDLGRGR